MALNEKGGFRPPPLTNLTWRCTCGAFNKADAPTCKKCGGDKVVDETIAGAEFAHLTEAERRVKKD